MRIREANLADFDAVWDIFQPIVQAGDTYAYPPECTQSQAAHWWFEIPQKTFVLEHDGVIVGTYYIKANQAGAGAHVCNCGYMVSPQARGLGLATVMCEHSQDIARELGFKAMQFNFVAATNTGAIRLWEKLGFTTVGRLPQAFNHPQQGYVDALVMYKWLVVE